MAPAKGNRIAWPESYLPRRIAAIFTPGKWDKGCRTFLKAKPMTSPAISRVLQVCEALQRSSGPVCAGTLAMSLSERTQRPWSKRTVLRDLQALSRSGYVKRTGRGNRGATVRWQWSGAGMLRTTA